MKPFALAVLGIGATALGVSMILLALVLLKIMSQGLVWIEGGQVYNLNKVVAEKGIPATTFSLISDDQRGAYERSGSASRYTTSLGGKNMLVTPSETLAQEVRKIIQGLGA